MGGFDVSLGAPTTISDTTNDETVTRNKSVENKNNISSMGGNLTPIIFYFRKIIPRESIVLESSSYEEEDGNVKFSGIIEFPKLWRYGRCNQNSVDELQITK